MFVQQPHLAVPAETEIRNPTVDENFPNQIASAAPHIDPVPTAAVDVPVNVALDPIRRARVRHGEDAPVDEEGARVDEDDVEGVDGRGTRGVRRAVAVHKVRVGDVHRFLTRRETDAVRPAEAVGHDADVATPGLEAVDLLRQLRWRPEALLVAVDGIGEPEAAVRVDDDVVGRVERATVIVAQQRRYLVRLLGFHVDKPARFVQGALGAEENAVEIVDATVRHVVAFRTPDFVTGEVFGAEELNLGDDDGLLAVLTALGSLSGMWLDVMKRVLEGA